MGPIYSGLVMIPEELSPAMVREAEKEFRRVVGYLYPLRRDRQLTKVEFEKQYRKASEEHFVVLAAEPLLPLGDTVERALVIVALARLLRRKTFKVRPSHVDVAVPRSLRKKFNQFERQIEGVLLTLLDESRAGKEIDESESVKVDPVSIQSLLFQAAFLRLFTGIEAYLQDTLVQGLAGRERALEFSRNLRDEDIPTRWPDGKKIRAIDYAFRWNEILQVILRFPYHEFEGRVSYRFKACFGFDLKGFGGLDRLIYFRNMRNRLVHRGSTRLGLPLVEITESHVLELAKLAYQLAVYVEERKPAPRSKAG